MKLLTIGHGSADRERFTDLLTGAEVEAIVDVRRFPGSRRHPQFSRAELQRWLPEAGIAYRWEERLGGRRRPAEGSPHTGWRNASFRAYADHLDTEDFRHAIGEVLDDAHGRRTAVMCAETLWWRCHRRLIADHVTLLAGSTVDHLLHDGRSLEHPPTAFVRVEDGSLVYDVAAEA